MRRVNDHLTSNRSAERGAVAIVLAMALTVLFALCAFAVDVSALHQERRELQNGADAAALALAQGCALGSCGTSAAMNAKADALADANAHDGTARIVRVDVVGNEVTVRVGTDEASGGADGDPHTFDYAFAKVIGFKGNDVQASATARWSPLASAGTLPITFSLCEWKLATADGAVYYHLDADGRLDPYPTDPPTVIRFHDAGNGKGNTSANEVTCAAEAGQDINHDGQLPGGFGWLDSSNCFATITVPGWVAAKPGVAIPSGCDPSAILDKALLIAVFADEGTQVNQTYGSCTTGTNGKCYFLEGFAQFYVTGYRFPGAKSANPPCPASDTCIGGYFVDGLIPVSEVIGGGTHDFGPSVVELVN